MYLDPWWHWIIIQLSSKREFSVYGKKFNLLVAGIWTLLALFFTKTLILFIQNNILLVNFVLCIGFLFIPSVMWVLRLVCNSAYKFKSRSFMAKCCYYYNMHCTIHIVLMIWKNGRTFFRGHPESIFYSFFYFYSIFYS